MSHREVICLTWVQCHRLGVIDEELYADSSFKGVTVHVGVLRYGLTVCRGTDPCWVNTRCNEEITNEFDASFG